MSARSRQPSSSAAYVRWRRPISRPLDTRLDREEGMRTAAAAGQGSAAIRRHHIWRAPASMRRRPPASVSPTKPPRPSPRFPTRRNWSAPTATARRLPRLRVAQEDTFSPKIHCVPKCKGGMQWHGLFRAVNDLVVVRLNKAATLLFQLRPPREHRAAFAIQG
jgi:hypothetical protein